MQKSKLPQRSRFATLRGRQFKIQNLRRRYPKFIYERYTSKIFGRNLKIFFDFVIEPDIRFRPKIVVKNIGPELIKRVGDRIFNNLIFNLGLMEIPSYWKTTCSPEIIIKPGFLSKTQIKWWKDLIIKGMGQFFYENKIDWTRPNFLKISGGQAFPKLKKFNGKLKNRYLVPFAGGRDSIVTLESLKKQKKDYNPPTASSRSRSERAPIALFMVNPTERILKTAKVSGIKKQIIIKRIIDKKLPQLNKKGYLNGHTPFTALLSFLSVFCAVLFDYKNIVFSNEKSADEGNVKYLGKTINHQWAKSSEFEKMFRKYCKKYLAKNINYSSYLRRYGELEISKMLTKYPKYFPVFSSCNASMKIGARQIGWCGNCPKCLFVYATLYPFLNKKDLLKIFDRDIFENKSLLPVMKSLIGERGFKPFECVGTRKESKIAFKLSLDKAKKSGELPYLLTKFVDKNGESGKSFQMM